MSNRNSQPVGEGQTGKQPSREALTKPLLNGLLKTRWDTKETGLQVLVSRGPKHQRKPTISFRVVY